MGTVTLEQIHQDMIGLKKEVEHIKIILEDEGTLSEETIKEVKESRKNKNTISNEVMRKEFN